MAWVSTASWVTPDRATCMSGARPRAARRWAAARTAPVGYNGFSVGDGGLALTYAGFTVGGNVLWGAFNGQVQLKPQGGANAVAWVAGAQYAIGPLTLDASYLNYQSAGRRRDGQQVAELQRRSRRRRHLQCSTGPECLC